MQASDINKRVASHFVNHDHHFHNKYIFRHDWESDFFCVSNSGYCIEVETKISKSDFKADFKKDKHALFAGILLGKRYVVQKVSIEHRTEQTADEIKYHSRLSSRINIIDLSAAMPNKFWYACPEGVIDLKEVPKYAGLIYVTARGEGVSHGMKIIKPAPFIHKNKVDLPKLLFNKYVWQTNELQQKIRELESERKFLKKKLNEGGVLFI